jgi:hypothetical protein
LFSSRISTRTPASLAIAAQRLANSRGVSMLPGSLARSRARLLDSPRMRPRVTASVTRDSTSGVLPGAAMVHVHDGSGAGSVVL